MFHGLLPEIHHDDDDDDDDDINSFLLMTSAICHCLLTTFVVGEWRRR